jgi:uncharacterized protein (DUF1015 family)
MADIKPFKGIRPSKERAAEIAALPYDVYSRQEAKAVVQANPGSFLAIDRAETGFGDDVGTYDDVVYERAHDLLWQWIGEGRFLQDEEPCYYLYELTMEGRSQTGIVACASVDDYEQGIIRKHENTRAEKEADRIRHVKACHAQTGPIFLAYRANGEIDALVEQQKMRECLYDFVSEDGIRHRVFRISDKEDIAFLQQSFSAMSRIYIADGHHRAASAVRVGQEMRRLHPDYQGNEEFNYFLSVLFPDNQLRIMDYNRVVKDLAGRTPSQFLEEVAKHFDVMEQSPQPLAPTQKGEFSMYLSETWYRCRVRQQDQSDDPVEGLDVSLLQNLLLEPLLKIQDPRTDSRIDFVGGIRGLGELERRRHQDCQVAFAMYPTGIDELFAVADAGRLMPPKSTWFEPKLRSGLFIHDIG